MSKTKYADPKPYVTKTLNEDGTVKRISHFMYRLQKMNASNEIGVEAAYSPREEYATTNRLLAAYTNAELNPNEGDEDEDIARIWRQCAAERFSYTEDERQEALVFLKRVEQTQRDDVR